ncbi:MAG: hypothetical protein Ct9H300mP14_13810 [Gammaproteobacteria bacterium]|nr:MAG: hypothetical protein Ct9H300mP14_13810 [Gammaproteobacteria bacterium]
MLDEIGTRDRITKYLGKAQDPQDNFRLMGFGHRVYKNHDPRAKGDAGGKCHEGTQRTRRAGPHPGIGNGTGANCPGG